MTGEKLEIKKEFRDLIPPLSKEELDLLEKSVFTRGCQDSIKTWKGYIIDGHHRYEICNKHNISFKTEEMEFEHEILVKQWMIDNQFGRRNLPLYMRLDLSFEYEELEGEKAKERQGERNDLKESIKNFCSPVNRSSEYGRSLEKVSRKAKCGYVTAFKYKKIKDAGLEKRVYEGESIKKVYNDIRRENRQEILSKMAFPKGNYRVIYADPPWQYNTRLQEEKGGAEDHYHTMSLEEICALPVPSITDKNAVLFLWVTAPLLESALKVMEAWGFKYKAHFIWDKVKHNMGHYNSVRHEMLFVGTKGSCVPDKPKLFDSVQSIERSATHSEKPEVFRQIIDTLYRHGNKLELFSRKRVEGWEVYGNEVEHAAI